MKTGKFPGIDGLTVEFYRTFWNTLKYDLIDVIKECNNCTHLPNSNTALIRLIDKNKGCKEDLRNWRPISLLRVDYKLISKVITNRLEMIMPDITGENRTCGVPERNIHDNLSILRDGIYYINFNNLEGGIMSIDQEKAFDRIDWIYVYSIMEKMGIPAGLIQWCKLL